MSKRFDVFVSHSKQDRLWVLRLVAELDRHGISVWPLTLALNKNQPFRLIPVRLHTAELPGFLAPETGEELPAPGPARAGLTSISPRARPSAPGPEPTATRVRPSAPGPEPTATRVRPSAPGPEPTATRARPRAPAPEPTRSRALTSAQGPERTRPTRATCAQGLKSIEAGEMLRARAGSRLAGPDGPMRARATAASRALECTAVRPRARLQARIMSCTRHLARSGRLAALRACQVSGSGRVRPPAAGPVGHAPYRLRDHACSGGGARRGDRGWKRRRRSAGWGPARPQAGGRGQVVILRFLHGHA
jgi:hypothetical protein